MGDDGDVFLPRGKASMELIGWLLSHQFTEGRAPPVYRGAATPPPVYRGGMDPWSGQVLCGFWPIHIT